MKRSDFLKSVAVFPLMAHVGWGQSGAIASGAMGLIRPKRLSPGDTIRVIAPSSGLSPAAFDAAIRSLESLGFKAEIGRHAREQNGIFAGTDQGRLEDLHDAFADSKVRGVWCVRGGNGSQRLLPALDFSLLKRNPKVFVGYSDITALHTAIQQEAGLITFHGPVGTSTFSDYTRSYVLKALTTTAAPWTIERSEFNRAQTSELYKTRVITPGKARGRLIGGNLTMIASLAGTPWGLANLKGKLLLLEAVDEEPWRIERMLTQLRESVDLRSLAGIALGIFEGCVATEKKPSPPLFDVVKDRLGDLGLPAIYGLSFGHIRDQFTLPLGIEAELDTEAATMTFLEAGVS